MDTDGHRFFGRPPSNKIFGMQIHDGPASPVLALKEVTTLAFHEQICQHGAQLLSICVHLWFQFLAHDAFEFFMKSAPDS